MSIITNSARVTVLALTLTGIAMPFAASATSSPSPSPAANCVVKAVGTKNTAGDANSRFTVNGSTVTSKFVVTGNENCKVDVTLAAWTAPDAVKGLPYSSQKLFSYATGSFGVGTHSLSTKMPDCFYQIDLVPGSKATDSKGGPQYNAVDGTKLLGSLHGGTKVCVTPTPTPTPSVLSSATVLPVTGGGDFADMLGLASMLTATVAYVRSRRA